MAVSTTKWIVAIIVLCSLIVFSNIMYIKFYTSILEEYKSEIAEIKLSIKRLSQMQEPAPAGNDKLYGRYPVRDVPDSRPNECKSLDYDHSNLPQASIVIVTHNERDSLVLRTVASILARTPEQLLHSIVVVDDGSDPPLDSDIFVMPKVVAIRHKKQLGLVQSRIDGADKTDAPIIIFLDAHCEANHGWLEPLIARVREEPRTIVWPVIDVVDFHDFRYVPIDRNQVGGMKLPEVQYIYENAHYTLVSGKGPTEPISTPIMPGGLFAISREWWIESGKYDVGMTKWGTENLEMSVRAWVCGGKIEIHPCSHVGHVFRDNAYAPNYVVTSGRDNLIRFVELWLDDYKQIYYEAHQIGEAEIKRAIQGMEPMLQVKKELQCKSFKWYHENVYPWLKIPSEYKDRKDLDILKTSVWHDRNSPDD